MRKFLVLLVAVAFLIGWAASASALNIKENLEAFNPGASTTDHERAFTTVYNYTDETLSNGQVVTWDLTSDDGRSVTKVNRLGQKVAGVVVETFTKSTWGRIQVYGYHEAVVIAGAGNICTTGYNLYAFGISDNTGTDNTVATQNGKACGGYNTGCPTGDAPLATSYQRSTIPNPFGIALDTTTTGTTVEAFINCL